MKNQGIGNSSSYVGKCYRLTDSHSFTCTDVLNFRIFNAIVRTEKYQRQTLNQIEGPKGIGHDNGDLMVVVKAKLKDGQ